MIKLDDFCTADPVTEQFEAGCLELYQARVAEGQQIPAAVFEVLPFVILLLAFGVGLTLGRGGR